jgi:hypothetical protein
MRVMDMRKRGSAAPRRHFTFNQTQGLPGMAPILLHDYLYIAQSKRMSFSRFEDLSMHTSLLCGRPCSSQPRYSSAGRSSP